MDTGINQKIIEIKSQFFDAYTECIFGEIGLNELMGIFNELNKQITDIIVDDYMREKNINNPMQESEVN